MLTDVSMLADTPVNVITGQIIGGAIEVHRILGPGLLVENLVVVEMKSLDYLLPVGQAQLLTYMRLTGCPAGLLINFNVPKLITGVAPPFLRCSL